MSNFNVNQKLGEIVTLLPKASEVFKKYNIDFCCGGHRLLGEAIREEQADEKVILDALDQAFEESKKYVNQNNFTEMKSNELIDYIINVHHQFLRVSLPITSELVTKILRVHGAHHQELFTVHKLFHALKADLEQHLIKEEELLFPLIKEYEVTPSSELLGRIKTVMNETEEEHEVAGGVLKELRKITNNYELPEDGCQTYDKTFENIQEIESDLFEHIHLENNILFRRLSI